MKNLPAWFSGRSIQELRQRLLAVSRSLFVDKSADAELTGNAFTAMAVFVERLTQAKTPEVEDVRIEQGLKFFAEVLGFEITVSRKL